jgi:16S rRNA (uracil1498-N3)-methyltransferase
LTINNKEIALKIINHFSPGGEPPVKITLVQGLNKGDKMEYIVQKATELGVTDIIPMICHRSVVRLEGVKAVDRQERWQRVALEAAKQCRRAIIPKVHEIQNISEVLEKIPLGTLSFLPWEQEKSFGLREILSGDKKESVFIFIGPEGGFEEKEVKQAIDKGVAVVTLGDRILRTETAGLACAAIVMFQWGDIN